MFAQTVKAIVDLLSSTTGRKYEIKSNNNSFDLIIINSENGNNDVVFLNATPKEIIDYASLYIAAFTEGFKKGSSNHLPKPKQNSPLREIANLRVFQLTILIALDESSIWDDYEEDYESNYIVGQDGNLDCIEVVIKNKPENMPFEKVKECIENSIGVSWNDEKDIGICNIEVAFDAISELTKDQVVKLYGQ